MPQSPLRLVRRYAEHLPQCDIELLPRGLRGLYVLYRRRRGRGVRPTTFNVVYVGMAWSGNKGGIRGRLRSHVKRKGELWTHVSVFEVWDNIRNDEIAELEGLFRHIYRLDAHANALNVVKGFKPLKRLNDSAVDTWVVERHQET